MYRCVTGVGNGVSASWTFIDALSVSEGEASTYKRDEPKCFDSVKDSMVWSGVVICM